MSKILMIDNYDSFTYNVVQYLGELHADVKVVRNDEITLEQVEALARTPELDALLVPLEAGLGDVPRVMVNEAAATRVAHGNPAPVIASDAEFGEECWAAHQGRAIALGRYMGGEFHPARVLNR